MVSLLKIPNLNKRNQLLLILILIIIVLPSYLIYDYTQHNPKFCTTCHLMNDAYDTWDQSAMHDLDCHKCHETDMVESMGHVVEVLFKDPQTVTKITEIDNELCIKCHASNNYEWIQIASTAGHKIHFFENQKSPNCINCHGLNLHVFKPPEEICLECHIKETWMNTSEIRIHCVECHEFSTRSLFPESEDCINCHDFVRVQTLMADLRHQIVEVEIYCMSCHKPHTLDTYEDCTVCHISGPMGLHNIYGHQSCALCHSPHSQSSLRGTCLTCHIDKETHYSITRCEICHSFIS